jgi:hypothetical protein
MFITPSIHITLAEADLILEALRALPAFRQYHAPYSSAEISEILSTRDYLSACFEHAKH